MNLERFLKRIVKQVLSREKVRAEAKVIFLDRQEIKELNRRYRKKNQATDVLAFPADEKSYLGEILLCQEKIKENAARFNQPFERELARTAIHGLLHLLGYNHERGGKEAKKMIEQQEKYLSEIKHS